MKILNILENYFKQKAVDFWSDENLIKVLKNGGIVVMPTDTLYGIVGRAENPETVERIYTVRKRAPEKPCIILISNIEDLDKFSVVLSSKQKNKIGEYWPGPVSIILDCVEETFSYLHRGTKTLAFRLPAQENLRKLLREVGPLIGPSANVEGGPVANNITEAKGYFDNLVDLYIDAGEVNGQSSKVIKLQDDGSISILRA